MTFSFQSWSVMDDIEDCADHGMIQVTIEVNTKLKKEKKPEENKQESKQEKKPEGDSDKKAGEPEGKQSFEFQLPATLLE